MTAVIPLVLRLIKEREQQKKHWKHKLKPSEWEKEAKGGKKQN